MKKYSPRTLVLVAVALLMVACTKQPTLDPRSAATEFFQTIGESRFQEAYDSTAFAFRAQTNFRSFQATAKELGLNAGTVSCNWQSEEIKDRDVKLSGELLSTDGTTVPVRLTLIEERGAWRVFALRTPRERGNQDDDRFSLLGKGASFNSAANHALPSPKVLNDLTLSSLMLFNDAVLQRSFGEFYSKVSLAWQNQLTTTQLKQAFQPFIDAKVDLSDIQKLQPVFDTPPEITSEGILNIIGHYDTKPVRTFFSLKFIYEFPYWKLYGIEVKIRS